MHLHTSGAIALRLTGNIQDSFYFLSLHSGKRIVQNNWTTLPMPAKVIATVYQLAKACKKYKGIVFMDKEGNIINDENDPEQENDNCTGVQPYDTMDANDFDITGVDKNDAATN